MCISCFEGTSNLQIREGRIAYTLQKPLWEEPGRLQKQQIIVPLDVHETSKWCNSFMLVLKLNGKFRLCLDLAQFKIVLIRPVYRGLTINDILPWLAGVKYLMLINESTAYHKLRLDE